MKERSEILQKERIFQLLDTHKDKIKSLGVYRLGLFGSYIRGEQHESSDLDFLVEFEPGQKNLKNYFALIDWLEKSFDKEVELITKEALSPYIGPHIEREVVYVPLTG